jgi:hypothetical protein
MSGLIKLSSLNLIIPPSSRPEEMGTIRRHDWALYNLRNGSMELRASKTERAKLDFSEATQPVGVIPGDTTRRFR